MNRAGGMTGATPAGVAITAIVAADGRRMARDRLLKGMSLYIFLISVLMRWGVPWFTSEVQTRWSFDLMPYYPLVTSYLAVLLGAVMVGVIGGFLMLETREEGTIRALMVSPLSTGHYLGVMSIGMTAAAVVVSLVQALIIGVGLPPLFHLLVSTLFIAPTAPITAFFLASFSDNRVEAFVQAKIVSVAALVAAGAWFVPEPWQFVAGIIPPYWGVKAYWIAAAGGSDWALWLAPGLVTSVLWLWVLGRRFRAVARL
jgi:fluoroquinolone transport system permease protein